jgi:hypothetical protein
MAVGSSRTIQAVFERNARQALHETVQKGRLQRLEALEQKLSDPKATYSSLSQDVTEFLQKDGKLQYSNAAPLAEADKPKRQGLIDNIVASARKILEKTQQNPATPMEKLFANERIMSVDNTPQYHSENLGGLLNRAELGLPNREDYIPLTHGSSNTIVRPPTISVDAYGNVAEF